MERLDCAASPQNPNKNDCRSCKTALQWISFSLANELIFLSYLAQVLANPIRLIVRKSASKAAEIVWRINHAIIKGYWIATKFEKGFAFNYLICIIPSHHNNVNQCHCLSCCQAIWVFVINTAFSALAVLHLTYLGSVFNSSVNYMDEEEVSSAQFASLSLGVRCNCHVAWRAPRMVAESCRG